MCKNVLCVLQRTRNYLSLCHTDPLHGFTFFSMTKYYLGIWNEIASTEENKLVHPNKERSSYSAECHGGLVSVPLLVGCGQ